MIKLQNRDKGEYRSVKNWYGSGKKKKKHKEPEKGEYSFPQCERNRRTKSKQDILREIFNAGQ